MSKAVYNAEEVAEILTISKSKAYVIIRELNEELTKKGFYCARGKVSIMYFHERFNIPYEPRVQGIKTVGKKGGNKRCTTTNARIADVI